MAKAPRPASEAASAAVSPETDGRSAYVVSDKAPPRVAGRRVQAGDVLHLTEAEARGELLALHIRPEVLSQEASKDV